MNRDQLRDRFLTVVSADEADRMLEWVDRHVAATAAHAAALETWTADQVADFTGQKSIAAGRAMASRLGVRSTGTQPNPESGRPMSVYPAQQIRDAYRAWKQLGKVTT